MDEQSRREAYDIAARMLEKDADHLRVIREWTERNALASFDALMDRLQEMRLGAGEDRREVVRALNGISSKLAGLDSRLESIHTLLVIIVIAGLVGMSVLQGASWLPTLLMVCAAVWWVGSMLKHWIDGRRGLGQWPSPHGRFYDEWRGLSSKAGNYYPWLAAKMGNREPWRTWAEREPNE